MTPLLSSLLFAHILFGVLGVISSYTAWMCLVKKFVPARLLKSATLGCVSFFVLSWLSGGYYYTVHYGTKVKPVIKEGPYPLAHSIVMEAKEHIFLLLPFLAITLACAVWLYQSKLDSFAEVKRGLVAVAAVMTVLSVAITLGGMIISGAVR